MAAQTPKGSREIPRETEVNLPGNADPIKLLGSVFASERPKHAVEGLTDGLRNITAGVGLGLGSLIAIPISRINEGAEGVVKGIGMGLLSCVGITTYGVVTGVRQAVRGVYHTKEAITETVKGERFWDSTEGEWVSIYLARSFEDLPLTDSDLMAKARELYQESVGSNQDASSGTSNAAANSPSEEDYYALLGVPKAATASEIHGAFHRKALALHPDKNPNDPEATSRFQKLLEANNVLSNEDSRQQYDAHGTVDPSQCQDSSFTQIEQALGAEFLEPFIGRVMWALYFVPNVVFDDDLQKEIRRRRTLRLARFLARYTDGDVTMDDIAPAIRDAISTRAGPNLMTIVAEQYDRAARQHLYDSRFLSEMDSFASSKVAGFSQFASACSIGVRGIRNTLDQDDVVNLMTTVCEPDVRRTVLRASRYLLYDLSVTAEQRKCRAAKLAELSAYLLQEVSKSLEETRVVSTPAEE